MKIDVIAFSSHPDDAEMGCGGLLLKLKDKGYHTGIVDLTEAELSTNGDIPTRKEETKNASLLLGLDIRENLKMEDCNLKNDFESRQRVIDILRKYRPSLVITPFFRDRHPDHENAYKLLKDAIFVSGLYKFKTDKEAHRPKIVLNYMLNYPFDPSFIADISEYHDKKMQACLAYKSQFLMEETKRRMTYVNTRIFQEMIVNRDKCHGLKIRSMYGEPFFIENEIKIEDPISFFDYLF